MGGSRIHYHFEFKQHVYSDIHGPHVKTTTKLISGCWWSRRKPSCAIQCCLGKSWLVIRCISKLCGLVGQLSICETLCSLENHSDMFILSVCVYVCVCVCVCEAILFINC